MQFGTGLFARVLLAASLRITLQFADSVFRSTGQQGSAFSHHSQGSPANHAANQQFLR
jgi:hypothetical protein